MMIPTVTVDSLQGFLFRALHRDAFCFVPADFIQESDGQLVFDELAFVRERWSVRNMRWAYNEPGGSHLFPDLSAPVTEPRAEAVQEFLGRASHRSRPPF